jgi:hypothetical protein
MRTHSTRMFRRRTKTAAIRQAATPNAVTNDELLPVRCLQHRGAGATQNKGRQFVTSVVDAAIHLRREAALAHQARLSAGRRGQPPMVDRLRAATILADRLETDGIPFATARASRMNNEVRKWLNGRSERTPDQRKSRWKKIGPDAVQNILRQIKQIRRLKTRKRLSRSRRRRINSTCARKRIRTNLEPSRTVRGLNDPRHS